MHRYDPTPTYPTPTPVDVGIDPLVREVVEQRPTVLALDGPPTVGWDVVATLLDALRVAGVAARAVDVREHYREADAFARRTDDPVLRGDPEFARWCELPLHELFADDPKRLRLASPGATTIVHGPGSALVHHDRLWFIDHPKDAARAAFDAGRGANLGGVSPASERRFEFIDWPMLERHRREQIARWDRYVDLRVPERPTSLSGDALRRSLAALSRRPFRTRPVFAPGVWGGQWMREVLGVDAEGPNLAWSFELISPESAVSLGSGRSRVEVTFSTLLGVADGAVMGSAVRSRFGASFPIRFDYLDTMDGEDLSVHCHPRPTYMRDVFGWDYAQHETYYVMASRPGAEIFHGLACDVDLVTFRRDASRAAEEGVEFDPRRHVSTVPAQPHRLHLIPAGMPHASGRDNVVLEISATPYHYSLRLYDWLREDLDGGFRPVHIDHAFANLDPRRRGEAIATDVRPEPRRLRGDDGGSEWELSGLPELFFSVHRHEIETVLSDDTAGRFHVLNVVAGGPVVVVHGDGEHPLAYAETLLVPAAVGRYRIVNRGQRPARVVKAFVR